MTVTILPKLSIQVALFGDYHHLAEFVYTGWGLQVVFFISYLVAVACPIGLRERFLVFSFVDVTGTENKLLKPDPRVYKLFTFVLYDFYNPYLRYLWKGMRGVGKTLSKPWSDKP